MFLVMIGFPQGNSYYGTKTRGDVIRSSASDFVVKRLNSVAVDALNFAIPNKCSKEPKFPCWFSSTLKHCSNEKSLLSSL
jgi:hypothetical protein